MNFGQAIEFMKKGKRLQRKGWNGKGMFIYYVAGGNYPVQMDAIKPYGDEAGTVKYNPYLAMKTVDGSIIPWLASQADMLAEDWEVLE